MTPLAWFGGSLAFATPWLLAGLVLLPAIWLLLRLTPPVPRRLRFPAIRLLVGLTEQEETSAHTPWWVLLLRLALAAAIIVGLARPLLNPAPALPGSGPLLLVVDDGWAAARHWPAQQAAGLERIALAERDNRPVALLATAPQAGGEAPAVIGPLRAGEARSRLAALQPKPWPVDRARARIALDRLSGDAAMPVLYLQDGLADPDLAPLAERLQRLGGVEIRAPEPTDLPFLLLPPEERPGGLDLTVARAEGAGSALAGLAVVRALGGEGRVLARETARFAPGASRAKIGLSLPVELRNAINRLEIEGQAQVGGVVLTDDRFQRRPVGLVTAQLSEGGQSLLDDRYYLERALAPFAELRRGPVADLMKSRLSVLLLVDDSAPTAEDRALLDKFLAGGGMLVRFAGDRLADIADPLVPVRLRPGGRAFGTAMQWSTPAHLAPFEARSPFAGLTVPDDVTVTHQLLAEPTIDLPDKVWAALADGTPLVTGTRRGDGWLVLFHVPASADWSNLPLSGLFVDMLRRLVALSRGVATGGGTQMLPPLETLDGFAHLERPSATIAAFNPAAPPPVGPRQPPGYYGNDTFRRAVNLTADLQVIRALGDLPAGIVRVGLGPAGEIDLAGWLLAVAMALVIIDLLLSFGLRGLLTRHGTRLAPLAGLLLAVAIATPLRAAGDPARAALDATLETRLGYVLTGDPGIDAVSRDGMRGLTRMLNRRTAVEAADPVALDVAQDELAFFPLLYWPIAPAQPALTPAAVERVNLYLRNGGTILFDTRDAEEAGDPAGGSGVRRLQQLVRGLDIPPLAPIPPDHVLGKTFYLLPDFPGRYAAGGLWLELRERGTDEVASVILGSNDYAAAWAVDAANRPQFAVTPGGEQQREMAFRVGINLVMYALTGNYKTDQVHIPAILERLGQ